MKYLLCLATLILFMLLGCGGQYRGNGDCYPEQFDDDEDTAYAVNKDRFWFVNGELRQGNCGPKDFAPSLFLPDLLRDDDDI